MDQVMQERSLGGAATLLIGPYPVETSASRNGLQCGGGLLRDELPFEI
jgi:hypothetical protein